MCYSTCDCRRNELTPSYLLMEDFNARLFFILKRLLFHGFMKKYISNIYLTVK